MMTLMFLVVNGWPMHTMGSVLTMYEANSQMTSCTTISN